jgi:Fe-S cluster assembly protein SufD
MIHFAPNANRSDGYQKSSTLILSDDAKASAIPGLEILNNDVKCSHGATISNLSPDELFYLQTRGISRDEGEKLLTRGFFNQITELIKNQGNRKQFEQMIDKKLEN